MPLLVLLVAALIIPVVAIALMPLGLVQRYRAGKARRAARRWVSTLNIAALSFSVLLFLSGAAITSLWVPKAIGYSLAGLAGGSLLGMLGLTLTHWEKAEGRLYYTPNRFLALVITLVVAARLAYGLSRFWRASHLDIADRTWLVESGIPGSLAAGAIVLSYALIYWIGVSRRTRRHDQNHEPGM